MTARRKEVHLLLAVAGGEKTRTMAAEAADNVGHGRSVFAVRTIKNAKDLAETIRKRLTDRSSPYNPDRCICSINSDDGKQGRVNQRVENALKDDGAYILIVTHQTLTSFPHWNLYGAGRTLYIDELPASVDMASMTFTEKALAAIDSSLSMGDLQKLRSSKSVLKLGAERLHHQDIAEGGEWSNETSRLWRVMSQSDEACISVQMQEGQQRVKISAIRASSVFDHICEFDRVRLATMLFKGSLFEAIGEAKGIQFVDYEWPNQHRSFKNDRWVTLYPISDSGASRRKLDGQPADEESLFKKIIRQVLVVPPFKNPKYRILLYVNKDQGKVERFNALKAMGLDGKFELMPFDCHGRHEWQEEGRTEFALFLTSRWNPNFNECGTAFAHNLGIEFDALKRAYEVSQMLEPTAQAATRGVIRNDDGKGPASHIAVINPDIADWLQENVFPNATICKDYMLKSESATKRCLRSDAGWQATTMKTLGLRKEQARWVLNNIKKIEVSCGHKLDCHSDGHRKVVRRYIAEHRPDFGVAA